MSTRVLQFFALPEEFFTFLVEVTSALDLHPLLYHHSSPLPELQPGRGLPPEALLVSGASRIYLSAQPPDLRAVRANHFTPGQLGWVQVAPPRHIGNVLLIADISAKSDRFDHDTHQTHNNEEYLRLYQRIASRLRRRLRFPVWACNVQVGISSWTMYRRIGFTDKVRSFAATGGELMQEGVHNVRFAVEPPARYEELQSASRRAAIRR